MNIHIKDSEFAYKLMESALHRVEIGSKMYGNANENSDTDVLYILPIPEALLGNPLRSHHQLQYKCSETNTDHLFTFLDDFVKNTLTGDSTINFEVWQTIYKNSMATLEPLAAFKNDLLNCYSIVKAYLGFAKRDIKYFWRSESDSAKLKKLSHIRRGIIFTKRIKHCRVTGDYFDCDFNFKNYNNSVSYDRYLDMYGHELKELRTYSNKELENGEINFLFEPHRQLDLNVALSGIKDNIAYKVQKSKLDDPNISIKILNEFYVVNEKGLKY